MKNSYFRYLFLLLTTTQVYCQNTPTICSEGSYDFLGYSLKYPIKVREAVVRHQLKYKGNGIFAIDTSFTVKYGIFKNTQKLYTKFSIKHKQFLADFDNDPTEKAEDNYHEWVTRYSFDLPTEKFSFDSLLSRIEADSKKKFRKIIAKNYNSPTSPVKRLLNGREVIVYLLRIDDCLTIIVHNPWLEIELGPERSKFTSVDFVFFKSDTEIEAEFNP